MEDPTYGDAIAQIDDDEKEVLDVPTLYIQKSTQGQKLYFFGQRQTEMHLATIKADKSNKDEILEKIGSPYNIDEFGIAPNGDLEIVYDISTTSVGENTTTEIPNGFYNVGFSQEMGYYLIESECSMGDKYLDIGGTLDCMYDVIDKFYEKEQVYLDMDLKHKMGCLFYGPPGNGKTMALRETIKKYNDKAVIIFVDDGFPKGLVKNLKYYDHNYIFIFEELTQILYDSSELGKMLLFLDGELSLDKQLVLATTNYPESLPANLASRPGRFDKIIEVGDPEKDIRKKYLELLTKAEVDEEIIDLTEGMSIAYLKEVIISSVINEMDLKEAIKQNKARIKLVEEAFAPPRKALGLM